LNRTALLLLLGFTLTTCHEPGTWESPLPEAIGESGAPFPRPPLSSEHTRLAREAELLDDLFTLERVVKFEEKITLGRLGRVRYHRDKLLVLDTLQHMLHLFTDRGIHLETIDRKGQGPGEYSEPTNVYVDGDTIAVIDGGEHKILFYDFAGNFIRELTADNAYFTIYFPEHMIFRDDYVYMCDFPARHEHVPRIVALDRSRDPLIPVFGFGERLSFYFTSVGKKMPRYRTEIFEAVDDAIWTVPLYQTDIEIYDFNGHMLGVLPSGIDGISAEALEKVKNMKDHIQTTSLIRSFNLLHHDGIVIVQYMMPFSANIYDTNGNLIRKGLRAKSVFYTGAIGLDNGFLLSRVDTLADPEVIEKNLGPDALRAFLEAGYDPKSYEDDNPYLALSRPNW